MRDGWANTDTSAPPLLVVVISALGGIALPMVK